MNETQQAELLARWIAGELEGQPEGLDADVVESVLALKPELAPPPRLSIEDVLADVKVGPFAGSENPMPVNASLGRRPWWIAIAGVGGLSSLAAIGLVVVGLGLSFSRSGSTGDATYAPAQPEDAVVDNFADEQPDVGEGVLDLDGEKRSEESDKGGASTRPGRAPAPPPPAKTPAMEPQPAPAPAPRPRPAPEPVVEEAEPEPDVPPEPISRNYAPPEQAGENEVSSGIRVDPVSLRASARLGAGPQSQAVRDVADTLSRGDHVSALALCASGLASNPDTGTRQWLLALQGDAHQAAGDSAAAEQSWRAAVEVSPSVNPQ